MQQESLRRKMHEYVEKGDEKLLKLLYAVAKEYSEDDDFEYEFSEEEIKHFEERRLRRLQGGSKAYTWQEAKEIITGKQK